MPSKRKRKRIRKGARLPYWEQARIDPRKLKDYALDPDRCQGKAKGFAALGFGPQDWQYLHDEILRRLPDSEATEADISNPKRLYFAVRIPVVGKNKKRGVIVTAWCVDARKEPWLTTLYAQPERRTTRAD